MVIVGAAFVMWLLSLWMGKPKRPSEGEGFSPRQSSDG